MAVKIRLNRLGAEHQIELAHLCPVARTADGACNLLVKDYLSQLCQVAGIHGHGETLMQGITLLLMFQHSGIGGAELSLIESIARKHLAAFIRGQPIG